MAINSKLNFDIFARDKASPVFNKFGKEVQQSNRNVGGLSSGVKTLAKGFVGLVAVQKATDFLKESVAEGRESNKVNAQTATVLANVGKEAGYTTKNISSLSGAISAKTAIDDEQIQSNANMLLKFSGLNNAYAKSHKLLERSTALSTDLQKSGLAQTRANKLIAQSMTDPVGSLKMWEKQGVKFTSAEKKRIAALVEAGKAQEAGDLILQRSGDKFKNVAADQATAGDQFKVSMANLQEQVGTSLVPILDKMAIVGVKAVAWLQKNPAAMKAILIGLAGIAVAFTAMFIAANAIPIAIGAVVAGLIYAYGHFEGFRKLVQNVATVLGEAFRWTWNNVLQPVFKLIVQGIGVQLIAWGTLISVMGKIPGFGWAKKLGNDMKDAGKKALGLANNINDIPKNPKKRLTVSGLDHAVSQAQTLKSLLGGGGGGKKNSGIPPGMFDPDLRAGGGWAKGWTIAGEGGGPELIDLPGGSHVYNARQTAAMMGGGEGTTVINISVSGAVDPLSTARQVRELLLGLKSKGGVPVLGLA